MRKTGQTVLLKGNFISLLLSHQHKLKFWTGIVQQKIRCGMVNIGWYGFIGPTTSTTDISLLVSSQLLISKLATRISPEKVQVDK